MTLKFDSPMTHLRSSPRFSSEVNTTCLLDPDYLLGSLISQNKRKYCNKKKTVAKLSNFLSTLFDDH